MLVVTRHPETIQILKENGIINDKDTILEHATDDDLRGKDVIGTLPLDKAALCKSVTFVKWDIPLEARGKEWTMDDTRKYYNGVEKYVVRPVLAR